MSRNEMGKLKIVTFVKPIVIKVKLCLFFVLFDCFLPSPRLHPDYTILHEITDSGCSLGVVWVEEVRKIRVRLEYIAENYPNFDK